MNLKQLEYFVAVAENLNFTRAAEKCYISQTAITQQIQQLERTVGVPLFERDKHHVTLTTAGRVYLGEAQKILRQSEEALKLARLAQDGLTGEVKIGFVRGYGSSDLTSFLRSARTVYPNIRIEVKNDTQVALMESLEKGVRDLVFSLAPFAPLEEPYRSKYLKSYPVMAVLGSDNPLAQAEYLTYGDLKGQPFIMMEPGDRRKEQMEESVLIYERGGFFPEVAASEEDPETLLLMISAGYGISILPEYILDTFSRSSQLKALPLLKSDGSAETMDFVVSWNGENGNPALGRMIELLEK